MLRIWLLADGKFWKPILIVDWYGCEDRGVGFSSAYIHLNAVAVVSSVFFLQYHCKNCYFGRTKSGHVPSTTIRLPGRKNWLQNSVHSLLVGHSRTLLWLRMLQLQQLVRFINYAHEGDVCFCLSDPC